MRKSGRLNAVCSVGALVAATACAPHEWTKVERATSPPSEVMSIVVYEADLSGADVVRRYGEVPLVRWLAGR